MATSQNVKERNRYIYKYKDLEGNLFGPFKASQMRKWDERKLLDDDLTIFRISSTGETEEFEMKKLRTILRTAFPKSEREDKNDNRPMVRGGRNQSTKSVNILQTTETAASDSKKTQKVPNNSLVAKYLEVRTQLPQVPIERRNIETSASDLEVRPITVDFVLVSTQNAGERSLPTRHDQHFQVSHLPSLDVQAIETLNETIELPQATPNSNTVFSLPTEGISELARSSEHKAFDPDLYSSPPFMRLPDPGSDLIRPERARAKVFSLYQLIVTVPTSLIDFAPYNTETVCCELCKINLTGAAMFFHLINVQHLNKMSSCIFSASDVDFWIQRVHDVIQHASPSTLVLPGFEPEVHVNKGESVEDFINRTKGFVKKLSAVRLKRTPHTQFLDVAFNKAAATQYASNKSNRTKRKLTGAFLSQVVENLVNVVPRSRFQRQYGRLIDHHSECTFCNVKFEVFIDACRHIGSQKHREKTNILLYHEGLVATWVRLLSGFSGKRSQDDEFESIPAKKLSFPVDVVSLIE